jgi:crossover junction endodeoxyribonuclease RuvC
MRVLGVDPGSVVCGFGVVEGRRGALRCVAAGAIRPRPMERGGYRLLQIHDHLQHIIEMYSPDAMSLERHFVAANVQSAFRIGEARAMAMLAAARNGLPLHEYSANEVKLAITTFGHARKNQVKFMVLKTLNMASDSELEDDAADALALAICHVARPRIASLADAAQRRSPKLSRR